MTDREILLAMLERNGIGHSKPEPRQQSDGSKDVAFRAQEDDKVSGYGSFIAIFAFDAETEALTGVEVWE